MAENTKIEWADHSFNPWVGCTKVSPACDHCYASVSTPARAMKIEWGPGKPRHRTAPSTWKQPVAWNKAHAAFFAEHGRRQRVFCASLADVFDNAVDREWRDDLWQLIQDTPNLDWLLLTKRIGNVFKMLPDGWAFGHGAWPNVWIGATVVNQEEADRDIPKLLAVPARVRFLSIEPMLGPVNLRGMVIAEQGRRLIGAPRGIDWVIAGGESGPGARPAHPDWFRSLRDQCAMAGVPFLFKQWGEWLPCETDCGSDGDGYGVADDGSNRELSGRNVAITTMPDAQQMAKVGKKAAGRLLDGVEHNGFPFSVADAGRTFPCES